MGEKRTTRIASSDPVQGGTVGEYGNWLFGRSSCYTVSWAYACSIITMVTGGRNSEETSLAHLRFGLDPLVCVSGARAELTASSSPTRASAPSPLPTFPGSALPTTANSLASQH